MSMQIDFSSLTKKLSELEKKVQNKVSKEALEAGGDIMLNTQKQTVSVDTGALKASLSKGKVKAKRGRKRIEIGTMGSPEEQKRYSYYVNFGSKNKIGTFWIQEAWEKGKEKSLEAMKEVLVKELID